MDPLITVGITCFREGDWLRECWDSVLAQTDPRWVAIMVKDGSADDKTSKVFEGIQHGSLNKYRMDVNCGPYPCRNAAIARTTTPYYFHLDADDRLPRNAVSLALAAFATHQDAAFVYGDYRFFGEVTGVRRYPRTIGPDELADGLNPPGAVPLRRDLWLRLGGYADELARGMADFDFYVGAAEIGAVGWHCGEVIYEYRQGHSGRISRSYHTAYHEKCEIIVRRHPAFFREAGRTERFLGMGYAFSAKATFLAGDYGAALALAQRAADLGQRRRVDHLLGHWRYRRPAWAVPVWMCAHLVLTAGRRLRRRLLRGACMREEID